MHAIPNLCRFRTISRRFWALFSQKWQNRPFLKIRKILSSYLLWCMWPQIFVRFALSLTVSVINTFCTTNSEFWKFSLNYKFRSSNLLWCMYICSQIFIGFVLSLTASEISTFCKKMAKQVIFQNFGKFSNFCHLIYYDACDPKFSSVLLYLLPCDPSFQDKHFFAQKWW